MTPAAPPYVDPESRPLIYATSGTLSLGPGIEVSQKGELYVEGSSIQDINCGSF
jgi:hypothetical protein